MSHRSFANRLALPLLMLAGALAGCEPSVSPQFTVDEPGAVEGLLFFDRDEDNVFDPSDGDYALSGVTLQIRVRGDTDVLAGGTATSDASGRFSLPSLPAGTHDAFVDAATLPAGVVLCSNPLPITVEPGVTRFFTFQTRSGCLVLISTVKVPAMVGQVV
ncbi:MAG TPA: hypothetical protein VNP72_09910, partial [Longimicrobium sp.]|nr:hypothetical protein [Longimicrobium sp.]